MLCVSWAATNGAEADREGVRGTCGWGCDRDCNFPCERVCILGCVCDDEVVAAVALGGAKSHPSDSRRCLVGGLSVGLCPGHR